MSFHTFCLIVRSHTRNHSALTRDTPPATSSAEIVKQLWKTLPLIQTVHLLFIVSHDTENCPLLQRGTIIINYAQFKLLS